MTVSLSTPAHDVTTFGRSSTVGVVDPVPVPVAPTTVCPPVLPPSVTPQVRRVTRRLTRQDIWMMVGAGISALSLTLLLFGRLTPLDGRLGFAVVAFFLYIGIYTALVSLTEDRPAVIDRLMTVLLTTSAVVALTALGSVIVYVLVRGVRVLVHPNFYTQDMSVTGPLDPITQGGIIHAIAGTLIMTAIALVITVPLGLACAVFLNETGGRAAGFVRTVVTAMTALPSILAGLFVFATWILVLGHQRSGLAGAIAMSIMMLPIIIRSADVVLRLVPGSLREAAAALGAPHWRTVWHVVLPTARSGLTTAVILGVARGIGETAPVLLAAGVTSTLNLDPTANPMVSLPLAAFEFVRSPQENLVDRGFATAAVLLVLVVVLFITTRILGGRPAGHQSARQARATKRRSLEDQRRIEQSLAMEVTE